MTGKSGWSWSQTVKSLFMLQVVKTLIKRIEQNIYQMRRLLNAMVTISDVIIYGKGQKNKKNQFCYM